MEKSAVQIELDERRSDSEVKDILNDLERLKTVPLERKTRWVWELIQNAKDCALRADKPEDRYVDIEFMIESGKLSFIHNSLPFSLRNLVALITRTSDKEYIAGEGTVSTGKYGTGFVTSHILNRKVIVSGILVNDAGSRKISLVIDRTLERPDDLRTELNRAYEILDNYNLAPAENDTENILTKYEYELDKEGQEIAFQSMEDLKKDIAFVLLINNAIRSVTINNAETENKWRYETSTPNEIFPGIQFSELSDGNQNEGVKKGLFHVSSNGIVLALPVEQENQTWKIKPLNKEVRLFKEFPLVGTEGWHLPYFVQSKSFLPPETRDGIRTVKPFENKIDTIADQNRQSLESVRDLSISFFTAIVKTQVENIFLLTESGLPEEKTEFTAEIWFKENMQLPLRKFFRTHKLLKTATGRLITIEEAKIPERFEIPEDNKEFYEIAVSYYGDVFPEEQSYIEWQKILEQDSESWGGSIFCTAKQLVMDVHGCLNLRSLITKHAKCNIDWLNRLIGFLLQVGKTDLSGTYAIFPNQLGQFKLKQDIRIDPPLNPILKTVYKSLQVPIHSKLLDTSIVNNTGVSSLETDQWYTTLNDLIGKMVPSASSIPQFEAVLKIISLFRPTIAKERERWYLLAKQLLPVPVPDKTTVYDLENFIFDSAEFASIRYAAWLIQESKTVETFAATYFQNNLKSMFVWLNDFFDVLNRKKETYAELYTRYAVIPTQDNVFRKLAQGIYAEAVPFEDLFKKAYTDNVGKGSSLAILIKTEIQNDHFEKAPKNILTGPIDDLFIKSECEVNVEKDGPLNTLFHELTSWIADHEEEGKGLFPHFTNRQPTLYVKAYGPGMSKLIMAVHKLNWQPEDIEALATMGMEPAEIQRLVNASKMVGGSERLLREAIKIEEENRKRKWRKEVGDKAEEAFTEAMSSIKAYNIENPDDGYDFELQLPGCKPFLVEIKSTILSKGNIKMSGKQGRTAKDNPECYALCVVTREEMDIVVTKDYFIQHARFVTNIGLLVTDKVNGMENGLQVLRPLKDGEINSSLEDDHYSVYVSTGIWNGGRTFSEFVKDLETYFSNQKVI